jgi:hypothetical protein
MYSNPRATSWAAQILSNRLSGTGLSGTVVH